MTSHNIENKLPGTMTGKEDNYIFVFKGKMNIKYVD